MKTATVKTSELDGLALDYAVGVAMGVDGLYVGLEKKVFETETIPLATGFPERTKSLIKIPFVCVIKSASEANPYHPTVEWQDFIELFIIDVDTDDPDHKGESWRAELYKPDNGCSVFGVAETPGTAICRAVVAHLSGDSVEVPEVLLG